MRVCFYKLGLNHPDIRTWFQGMYYSFLKYLEKAGVESVIASSLPLPKADFLVVPIGGGQDGDSARAMESFSGPVILYTCAVDSWNRVGFLERWRDKIAFAYGADSSVQTRKLYEQLDINYLHLPFGSDPEIMHPIDLPKQLDVLFVGNANSGSGRNKYVKALLSKLSNYRIMLIGPGWEEFGYPRQSVAWGPLLNVLYNMSYVCINIINDEQKAGKNIRLDSNNRLFDIAMAGCLQISNAPVVVREYFTDSEVISSDDINVWVELIEYYLNHPEEAIPIKEAARAKAISEHSWKVRVECFCLEISKAAEEIQLSDFNNCSLLTRISRKRDTLLPPYSFKEFCNKALKRLRLTTREIQQ